MVTDDLALGVDVIGPAGRTPAWRSQLPHPLAGYPDDGPSLTRTYDLAAVVDRLCLARSGARRAPGVQVDHAGRLLPDEGVVIAIGHHAPAHDLAGRINAIRGADAAPQSA